MKKISLVKSTIALILSIAVGFAFISAVYADTSLDLEAKSVVLIDEDTGKILYEKDAFTKRYPASMTKILTAYIALEYLLPDDIIQVGSEINLIPLDSSMAGFVNGEYITVRNLLRGLLIKSGNETANVVAIAVARKVSGREDITYQEAEIMFCRLMNEAAEKMGAKNSNFANPHGYHTENHYTTAYDMALISREAMKNNLIRQISAEVSFTGKSADNFDVPRNVMHDWKTHNDLLIVTGEYYYPYATGIKTGFMDEAGYCISASAEKERKNLIAVVMFATEKGRLADSIKLFNYGFENFNYEQIHAEGDTIGQVMLENAKLTEEQDLNLTASDDFEYLLSADELEKLEKSFIFNDKFVSEEKKESGVDATEIRLVAPISKGTSVGTVEYRIDDQLIYSGEILAERDVEKRDIISNVSYFFKNFSSFAFESEALPYWFGAAAFAMILVILVLMAKKNKASRRSMYSYQKRRRY